MCCEKECIQINLSTRGTQPVKLWQKILDFPLRLLFLPNRLQKSLSINLILSVLFEEFFQSTTLFLHNKLTLRKLRAIIDPNLHKEFWLFSCKIKKV